MNNKISSITKDIALDVVSYDRDTGEFTRKRFKCKGVKCGYFDELGYLYISIHSIKVVAHRLAWMICYGEWPVDQIDHINGNTRDNRIENLRIATHTENIWNSKVKKSSKSGVKGVRLVGNKYQAQIRVNNKRKHLGMFNTLEEARHAYNNAAMEIHGIFACFNR